MMMPGSITPAMTITNNNNNDDNDDCHYVDGGDNNNCRNLPLCWKTFPDLSSEMLRSTYLLSSNWSVII